jgi:hypothetical protein
VTSQADFQFEIAGDSGSNHPVLDGSTFTLVGGNGITTEMVTNTTRFHSSWDYEEKLTGSGAFDVTLSGISFFDSNVKTLEIEVVIRSTVSSTFDGAYLLFNNDTTTTNYYRQNLSASAGAINTVTDASPSLLAFIPASASPPNSFFIGTIRVPNINSTNHRKIAYVHGAGQYETSNMRVNAGGVFWNNTSAITRIQIRTDNHPTDLFATNSEMRIRLIR